MKGSATGPRYNMTDTWHVYFTDESVELCQVILTSAKIASVLFLFHACLFESALYVYQEADMCLCIRQHKQHCDMIFVFSHDVCLLISCHMMYQTTQTALCTLCLTMQEETAGFSRRC